jgi:hypothetical protein
MVHPVEIALHDPRYFLQFRPDSDAVHKHLFIPVELKAFWMQGDEFKNSGDISRLYVLYHNLKALDERGTPGALAEVGVNRMIKSRTLKSKMIFCKSAALLGPLLNDTDTHIAGLLPGRRALPNRVVRNAFLNLKA